MYTPLIVRSIKMSVIVLMLWAHSTVMAVEQHQHERQHEIILRESGNATHNHTGGSNNEGLSGEAIANIVATAVAIALIGSITFYMCYCYNHKERVARVKAALERNKLIRQRIEAEKRATSNEQTKDNPTHSPVSTTLQQFSPT